MWIIALLFGFGLGGLCEYFRRERECANRNTKVGTPSASHNKPSVLCDKCGPNGIIDQYYWNYCAKCGRKLHTAHVG